MIRKPIWCDNIQTSALTDWASATYSYAAILTNSTTKTNIGPAFPFGDIGYPSSSGNGAESVMNEWGAPIELQMFGKLSTDATPGTLTIGVQIRTGASGDGSNVYVDLNNLTFTPDASLSNAPFMIRGLLFAANQYPKSVTGLFSFAGQIQYLSGSTWKGGDLVGTGTGTTEFKSVTIPALNVTAQLYAQWSLAKTTNILQRSQLAWLPR